MGAEPVLYSGAGRGFRGHPDLTDSQLRLPTTNQGTPT
jgi:hypothetical protein